MKQEIVLSIMGVIVIIELVCGVLIVMRALLAWAFGFRRSQIVNREVVHTYRPATLSEPMGPESVEPVRAKPVGPNVSVRVEVGGDIAVQIDVGSGKKSCVESQADVRDVTPDDTWSDF